MGVAVRVGAYFSFGVEGEILKGRCYFVSGGRVVS